MIGADVPGVGLGLGLISQHGFLHKVSCEAFWPGC